MVFSSNQVVHWVSVHKEVTDVVDGKGQVLVAAVVGGSAVFQAVASTHRMGRTP